MAEPYMKQDVLLPKGMSSSAMGALSTMHASSAVLRQHDHLITKPHRAISGECKKVHNGRGCHVLKQGLH